MLVGVRTAGAPMRVITRARARRHPHSGLGRTRDLDLLGRNEDATPRTLVIEHPTRDGWKLDAGQAPAEATRDDAAIPGQRRSQEARPLWSFAISALARRACG